MFGLGSKLDRLKKRLLTRIGTQHYWTCCIVALLLAVALYAARETVPLSESQLLIFNRAAILALCAGSVVLGARQMPHYLRLAGIYALARRRTRRQVMLKFVLWLAAGIAFTVILATMVTKGVQSGHIKSPPARFPLYMELIGEGVGLVNLIGVLRTGAFVLVALVRGSNAIRRSKSRDSAIVARGRR